jgi:glycosyltransferase involved in cell wall biosynthesis
MKATLTESPGTGSKKRVLAVIGSLRPGGAETYVASIAPRMRALGVDMEICALERTGPLLARLVDAGVAVHDSPFPRRRSWLNGMRMLQTIGAVRRLIARGKFDVVHTYLYSADLIGVPAARLAGCGRVIISRQAMHGWVHAPGRFRHGLEQTSNRLAHELIACSQATLRDAEAHERILPPVRTVIYNAVDVGAYVPARTGGEGPLRLVTVGALAHRKGQVYAIEALGRARAAGADAVLTLVGRGPDEELLRHKVDEAGLSAFVTFAGEQPDPRPYLRAADVFLLPSRQEGFSVALLEAMASSLPAIATDAGGNAEALVDGSGGRVVPPRDPEAMASAIVELIRQRPRLKAMGAFNRQRVADCFSIDASATKLADWYVSGPEHVRQEAVAVEN